MNFLLNRHFGSLQFSDATNNAAISLYTCSFSEWILPRELLAQGVSRLHFIIRYKFTSLTTLSWLPPLPCQLLLRRAMHTLLPGPRDILHSSSTWSCSSIWHLDLSLLPEATLASLSFACWLLLPHFLGWLLLSYLIKFWTLRLRSRSSFLLLGSVTFYLFWI